MRSRQLVRSLYAPTINMRHWQQRPPNLVSTTTHWLIRQFSLDSAVLEDDASGPGLSLFRLGVWLC